MLTCFLSLSLSLSLCVCVCVCAGLCVRSVCWEEGKVLAGTKDGEVFEASAQDLDNPVAIVEVSLFSRGD